MPQLVVDDILINYVDTGGAGPVLICVHGWMQDSSSYSKIIELLKDKNRLIAIDLPNFGKSQQTSLITTQQEYASLIANFVKKINIKSYALIGHSMGGQISIIGTGNGTLHPNKLILIAASGIRRQNLKKNVLSGLSSIVGPITPTKIKDKVYAYLGSDYSSALTPTLKQVIKYALSTDVSKFAKSINIPTLLLYGDADSSTPLWMGQELKELIPDARIQVIPGGDHWIHEKHPDEIANLIVGSTNG